MERILRIRNEDVNGTITVDLPNRRERLKLLKKVTKSYTDEKGNQQTDVDSIATDEEAEKRIVSCNLVVDKGCYDDLEEDRPEQDVRLTSYEDLANSPVVDKVLTYVTGVMLSGRLGKHKEEHLKAMQNDSLETSQ